MIIVVSDASPIINLAAVSRLSLLQELFGSILAPPSVWAEHEAMPADVLS
jgi:predicted nucleic acid-binding protein